MRFTVARLPRTTTSHPTDCTATTEHSAVGWRHCVSLAATQWMPRTCEHGYRRRVRYWGTVFRRDRQLKSYAF